MTATLPLEQGPNRDESEGSPEDELNTPFKRRVALGVTLVALLGGILGYLGSDAGARESATSRAAQQAAVDALTSSDSAAADLGQQFSDYVNASMLQRRHDVAVVGDQLLGQDAADGTAADWQAVADDLDDLTPLLGTGDLAGRPDLLSNQLFTAPDRASLEQQSLQRTAGSWGDKSNLYVGGVTLLAVAITLLGLALTVGARIRRLFVIPALALVVVTVVGSAIVAAVPPAREPAAAIDAVAEGDRLATGRDFSGAVEQFTKAITIDPGYAAAYAHRATAELLAGSPEAATSTFVVTTATPQARAASIADLDKALALGGDDYVNLVNQGANLLHLPDYVRSESFSRRAIALNADLPLPWINLGLALVGEGHEVPARDAYAKAIDLIAARPSALERGELYASARGALAQVDEQNPARDSLIEALQAQLVAAEGAALLPDGVAAPDATASAVQVSAAGSMLRGQLTYADVPTGATLAWIVYYRPDADSEWLQRTDLSLYEQSTLASSGTGYKNIFDSTCPVGGQYKVDVYAGGRLLGSASAPLAATTLALTPYADPVGGIWLCQADGWARDAAGSGSVTLTSPDQRSQLLVRTVPVFAPPSTDAARAALVDDVLDRLQAEHPGATQTGTGQDLFFPVESTYRALRVDARTDGYVWAYLGPDNVLRTVSATFPTGAVGDLGQLAARVHF